MRNKLFFVLFGFIVIFILSFASRSYFYPLDMLNYFPSFSEDTWTRPHNSLLADPIFQFEPWRNYAKERFLKGEFPLWNNLNAGGAPFFANPQAAVLYPLNFIYYLFSPNVSLNTIFLLKLYLFGIFLFLYLRSIQCSIKSSIITSVAYTFAGFPIVWLLWPQTNVYILFPLILYITEKIYKSKVFRHRWHFLLVLAYFVAVLGGHPETLFHVSLIHILYTIIRLWPRFKHMMGIFFSIFFGFLIASFQLFPFFEYLTNSYALSDRFSSSSNFYLPIKGFILNIFPFFLGAPHKEIYRPIDGANFQETIGGYTGPIILIFAFLGLCIWRKKLMYKLWGIIILFSWTIAYGIWPSKLITDSVLLRNIANQRLIAFAGFGIFAIFCLTLTKLEKSGFNISIVFKRILGRILIVTFIIVSGITLILLLRPIQGSIIFNKFYPHFVIHIALMSLTTIICFYLVTKIAKNQFNKLFWSLSLLILSQTLFLFFDYNSISPSKNYYPQTSITKKLSNLPKGKILEVGNPSLSQNLNLIYGFDHAENYDALEIYEYKKEFDKSFPIKNQWGKVDEITLENLQKFGVRYVVSDYNINLAKVKFQPKYTLILDPILFSKNIKIHFRLENDVKLRQIRILTANYNRKNTCFLVVKIIEEDLNKTLDDEVVSCFDIRDFMYYTIPFHVNIFKNKNYRVEIVLPNASQQNSIALWGNDFGKPYIEILYELPIGNIYKLLDKKKNTYLWETPDVIDIKLDGEYSILQRKPEKLSLTVLAKKNTVVEIKQTFYPGWKAKLDGKEVMTKNLHPFIGITVPKGGHILTLEYHPESFVLGLLLSFSSLVGLVFYLVRKEQKVKYINEQ